MRSQKSLQIFWKYRVFQHFLVLFGFIIHGMSPFSIETWQVRNFSHIQDWFIYGLLL